MIERRIDPIDRQIDAIDIQIQYRQTGPIDRQKDIGNIIVLLSH